MTQSIKGQQAQQHILPDFHKTTSGDAYIRQDMCDNELLWSIYDSNGDKIGYANSREMAVAVAYQNDLTPHNVH